MITQEQLDVLRQITISGCGNAGCVECMLTRVCASDIIHLSDRYDWRKMILKDALTGNDIPRKVDISYLRSLNGGTL